jgi:hypothetical protein
MQPGEETRVINLVSRVFYQYVAPLYSDEGVTEFMKYVDPFILAERTKSNHFVQVAESHDQIIGIIETRKRAGATETTKIDSLPLLAFLPTASDIRMKLQPGL